MKPQSTPLNNDCGALEDLPPKDIKESDKKMEKKSSPLSDFSDIKQTSVKDFEHITYDKEDSKGTVVTIFVCKFQDCEKTFTRSWNFLDHARTHLGIKPYSCPHCPRSFTQKGNLKKHMKQHSEPTLENRKKFVCTHCSSRYTEKYNLKHQECKLNEETKKLVNVEEIDQVQKSIDTTFNIFFTNRKHYDMSEIDRYFTIIEEEHEKWLELQQNVQLDIFYDNYLNYDKWLKECIEFYSNLKKSEAFGEFAHHMINHLINDCCIDLSKN